MQTRLDNKYKKYLEGKSVALVGPAEYLTKLDTGSYIDSHDVVVRINRGMELIDSYSNSIGERTDILYNCLIESPDNGGIIDIKNLKNNNVTWISTIPGSDINGTCSSNKLHQMVKKYTVFKINRNFLFHVMHCKDYSFVNQKINCRANTGFAAIYDLLNHGISKLYLTGFSFYLDNFISGYKKGCTRDEKTFAEQCFESKRHKQEPQWNYLKETTLASNVIEVDPILREILSMSELSKEKSPILK